MLHRSWVNPLVIGFWAVTSSWLVVTKILPAFQTGSPPDQSTIVAAGHRLVPVGWTVHWNGQPIGWALTESRRSPEGGVIVDSRLRCDRLPLEEILPGWAGTLLRRSLGHGDPSVLDATGRVIIDASGRLRSFTSAVTLPGTAEKVVLEGAAGTDGDVTITFRAGDLHYETTRRLPDRVMVGDELSPQAALPGLVAGRRWTVPVYSPLRPGTAPLQFLHAEAGGEETIFWGNRLVIARVVCYRDDPSSPREPRCRLWVDRSGRVLRHESAILGAKMEFVRRTDAEAERLARMAAIVDAPEAAAASADAPRAEDAP